MESAGHEITHCPTAFQGVVLVYAAASNRQEKHWVCTDHMPSRYWGKKTWKNRIFLSLLYPNGSIKFKSSVSPICSKKLCRISDILNAHTWKHTQEGTKSMQFFGRSRDLFGSFMRAIKSIKGKGKGRRNHK